MGTPVKSSPTIRGAAVPPTWTSVLAVIDHPNEEPFGLGAILDAFIFAGARVQMHCLTHGQSWALEEAPGDLAALRGAELASAADVLGPTRAQMRVIPDGALSELGQKCLSGEVVAAARACGAEGLLVFDTAGVAGDLDHAAVTAAALRAGEILDLPVLGWILPHAVAIQLNQALDHSDMGPNCGDVDLRVTVERARRRLASHARHSTSLPGTPLRRGLELLADTKSLRWLRPSGETPGQPGTSTSTAAPAYPDDRPMRVEHCGGDRFDIDVRGHHITVDQPVRHGGEDTAATPTELFVASLASCVAFYARRYLARHNLPTEGLAVEATFEMGSRPARVAGITLHLIVPEGVPAERREPLLAVASHCTVHNTLAAAPDVSITLADADPRPAAPSTGE
ncbi:MAG: OsmC family protein [Dermatophilaceae bacterium]